MKIRLCAFCFMLALMAGMAFSVPVQPTGQAGPIPVCNPTHNPHCTM